MRIVIAVVGLACIVGCGKAPGSGSDAGKSDGGGDAGAVVMSPCMGAPLLAQSVTTNTSAGSAEAFNVDGGTAALFGQGFDGGTNSLSGYFSVSGYAANQSVRAQIVEYTGCATTGCPDVFDFSFTGPTGDDLYSSGNNCGWALFNADATGKLTPSIASGSTDGGNVGLLLTPQ